MGFAQEMKDFTAAFKIGADVSKNWGPKEKSFAERKYDDEQRERKAAEDAGERNIGQAGSGTPGVAGAAGTTTAYKSRGALDTDGSPAMDGTTSPDTYIAKTEAKESSGNPNAKNPASSATGLHQFTSGTWAQLAKDKPELGLTPDGRTDPEQSRRAMRAFTADNAAGLKAAGFAPTEANKYTAHFLGLGGAKDFLTALQNDPGMSAAGLLPKAAGANRSIFYNKDGSSRSVSDVYNVLTRKFSKTADAGALPTEGTPTVFAAEGGLIEKPETQSALPVDTLARPAVEDTSNSNSGGSGAGYNPNQYVNAEMANEAIDAGMRYLQKTFTSGSALAEADPNRGAMVKSFARNDDVPSHDDVKAADAAIDPKGELAPHLRSIARLNGAYDMYMKKGEPEKAGKIAASMALYARKVAMSGGTQMQALIEQGNISGAAKIAERVYNEMPNGMKVEITPSKQGINYKVFDLDGQPTDGGRMAIDELMRLATGLQDGTAWFQAMGFMGGQAKTHAASKSNQLSVRGGSNITRQGTGGAGRPAAAPRTTATERAAAADTAATNAADASRQSAVASKAGALNTEPDLTPERSNLPGNIGALPAELATVGAVPTTARPVQETEWGTGGGGAESIPYNAGTGISRVMPAEAQDAPGELEQSASRMATNTERETKLGKLAQGAKLDQALVAADKAYKAKADRKGVRTTDTAASRTEAAEAIELGFQSRTAKDGKEPAKLAPEKKAVVNSLATKIMRGNEGLTPEDAGRVLAEILEKGPAMRSDGSVGARGGNASVFLDSSSIRQIIKMYGGDESGAKGVDPGLSPRNYRMPPENNGKPRMDDREAYEKLGRNAPPEMRKRWSDNAAKAGAAMGTLMGDILKKDATEKGAKPTESKPETTLERIRRRRREAEERAKNKG